MVITLYGIPNCDTVKRSRAWFADQGVAYTFHDFKSKGVPADELDRWLATLGWEALVNKKGTTWRKLSPAAQAAVTNAKSARALMLREPSVIKRPIVAAGAALTVGFTPEAWADLAQGVSK
jgi:arsenate reductase